MNPAACTEAVLATRAVRRQRGAFFLEAVVGLLLLSVMAIGLAGALARSLATQRFGTTHAMAVLKMRNAVATQSSLADFCASAPTLQFKLAAAASSPTQLAVPTQVQCPAAAPVTVAVRGTAAFTETVTIQTQLAFNTTAGNANAVALLGGDGAVVLTQ